MINNKERNSVLRNSAISKGLCEQWQGEWSQDWDIEEMVRRFYMGIDFFLKTRYVSNDMLKEYFDKDFLRKHGVLVDDVYSIVNPDSAILIGDSESTIRLNGYQAATIYVTDNSLAKVMTRNNAFIIVHVLGNAQVEAEQKDKSRIVVITHSRSAKVISDDDIRIKEEYDYLTKKKAIGQCEDKKSL